MSKSSPKLATQPKAPSTADPEPNITTKPEPRRPKHGYVDLRSTPLTAGQIAWLVRDLGYPGYLMLVQLATSPKWKHVKFRLGRGSSQPPHNYIITTLEGGRQLCVGSKYTGFVVRWYLWPGDQRPKFELSNEDCLAAIDAFVGRFREALARAVVKSLESGQPIPSYEPTEPYVRASDASPGEILWQPESALPEA